MAQPAAQLSGITSRAERYAPSIIARDDECQRGINLGINVTVSRNGDDYAMGTVTMIATTCFELTNDTGSELIPHDNGPGVHQVITVHYPD